MEPNSLLEENLRLQNHQKKGLEKSGLKTVKDLIRFFPVKYNLSFPQKSIAELKDGDRATIFGKIINLQTGKTWKSRTAMARATLVDQSGKVKILWIHQPYIAKMFQENSLVKISGKATEKNGSLSFLNPEIEKVNDIPMPVLGIENPNESFLEPIYRETRGISSSWFHHNIKKLLKSEILDKMEDPIPQEILKKYNLPSLKSSLIWIHKPRKEGDFEAARKRFAFEEIFLIQTEKQSEIREHRQKNAFKITKTKKDIKEFTDRFPFTLTPAQEKSISDILADFKRGYPMSRLLEGDVGSGKTAVAAVTSHAVITTPPPDNKFGNLQVTYMAPTEILANQHFQTFIETFTGLNIKIGLLTGSGCKKFPSKVNPSEATPISKTQLLKWVKEGDIPILIGTHALIQKNVTFKNLAYVIIDEQHRFGIRQRQSLARRQDADFTQTDAEVSKQTSSSEFLYKDLTYTIRKIIFEVRKELGLGHKEIIYQRAIEEAFTIANIKFSREKRIPVAYQGKNIGVYVPDFVIEDKVILELKSLPFIGTSEKKQLWQYLKGSDYRLALLANFGSKEATVDRVVYDTQRDLSASSLRLSAYCPHLLTMTATPIPRTLALTIYGDLDLTLLDQMPTGRKPIITDIIPQSQRKNTYQKIKEEMKKGRQLYVICPRIDEPDPEKEMALNVKSVTEEALRLKKEVFPEYEIGILHSKLKKDDKEHVMKKFEKNEIQILVATSVVEVGVNVPNATIIIIEGAERFGLAQLHQLRGRVIRSNDQAYCYVFSNSKTKKSVDRLNALKTAKNGFELAELDLKQRGAGELSGKKQWGISDLGMEAIKNIKMVEAARKEAQGIIEKDPNLKNPELRLIKEYLEKQEKIHFE